MPSLSRWEKEAKKHLEHSDSEVEQTAERCPICSSKYIRLPRTIRSKTELECGHHCCRMCASKTSNCAICEKEVPLPPSTSTSDNNYLPRQADSNTYVAKAAQDAVVDRTNVVVSKLSSASAESGVDRCVRADTVSNRAADTRTHGSRRLQWYATDPEGSMDDNRAYSAPNAAPFPLGRLTTVVESEHVPTVPLSQVSTVVSSTVSKLDAKSFIVKNGAMVPKIVSFTVPVPDNVPTNQDRASRETMREADRKSEEKIHTEGEHEMQSVDVNKVNEEKVREQTGGEREDGEMDGVRDHVAREEEYGGMYEWRESTDGDEDVEDIAHGNLTNQHNHQLTTHNIMVVEPTCDPDAARDDVTIRSGEISEGLDSSECNESTQSTQNKLREDTVASVDAQPVEADVNDQEIRVESENAGVPGSHTHTATCASGGIVDEPIVERDTVPANDNTAVAMGPAVSQLLDNEDSFHSATDCVSSTVLLSPGVRPSTQTLETVYDDISSILTCGICAEQTTVEKARVCRTCSCDDKRKEKEADAEAKISGTPMCGSCAFYDHVEKGHVLLEYADWKANSHLISLTESVVSSFSESMDGLESCARLALREGRLVVEMLNMLRISSDVECLSRDVLLRSGDTIRTETNELREALGVAEEAMQKLKRKTEKSKATLLKVVEECGCEDFVFDDSIRRTEQYDEREISDLDDSNGTSNCRESAVKRETMGGEGGATPSRSVRSKLTPNDSPASAASSRSFLGAPSNRLSVDNLPVVSEQTICKYLGRMGIIDKDADGKPNITLYATDEPDVQNCIITFADEKSALAVRTTCQNATFPGGKRPMVVRFPCREEDAMNSSTRWSTSYECPSEYRRRDDQQQREPLFQLPEPERQNQMLPPPAQPDHPVELAQHTVLAEMRALVDELRAEVKLASLKKPVVQISRSVNTEECLGEKSRMLVGLPISHQSELQKGSKPAGLAELLLRVFPEYRSLHNIHERITKHDVELCAREEQLKRRLRIPRYPPKSPCVLCTQPGHWMDECEKVRSVEERLRQFDRRKLCLKCHRFKHVDGVCRMASRYCGICRDVDHVPAFCLQRAENAEKLVAVQKKIQELERLRSVVGAVDQQIGARTTERGLHPPPNDTLDAVTDDLRALLDQLLDDVEEGERKEDEPERWSCSETSFSDEFEAVDVEEHIRSDEDNADLVWPAPIPQLELELQQSVQNAVLLELFSRIVPQYLSLNDVYDRISNEEARLRAESDRLNAKMRIPRNLLVPNIAKCIFCHQRAHWMDECRTVWKLEDRLVKAARENRCLKCNRFGGHLEDVCNRATYLCALCRSPDHLAAYCPQRSVDAGKLVTVEENIEELERLRRVVMDVDQKFGAMTIREDSALLDSGDARFGEQRCPDANLGNAVDEFVDEEEGGLTTSVEIESFVLIRPERKVVFAEENEIFVFEVETVEEEPEEDELMHSQFTSPEQLLKETVESSGLSVLFSNVVPVYKSLDDIYEGIAHEVKKVRLCEDSLKRRLWINKDPYFGVCLFCGRKGQHWSASCDKVCSSTERIRVANIHGICLKCNKKKKTHSQAGCTQAFMRCVLCKSPDHFPPFCHLRMGAVEELMSVQKKLEELGKLKSAIQSIDGRCEDSAIATVKVLPLLHAETASVRNLLDQLQTDVEAFEVMKDEKKLLPRNHGVTAQEHPEERNNPDTVRMTLAQQVELERSVEQAGLAELFSTVVTEYESFTDISKRISEEAGRVRAQERALKKTLCIRPFPAPGKCFFCGEEGHWIDECLKVWKVEDRVRMAHQHGRCLKCGRWDHDKDGCRLVTRSCGTCCSLDHSAPYCPQRYENAEKLVAVQKKILELDWLRSLVEVVDRRTAQQEYSNSWQFIPNAYDRIPSAFKIFVEDNEQHRLHIDCTPNCTVYELKQRVKYAEPDVPLDMTLVYNGVELENDRTLHYYAVPNCAIVSYFEKPVAHSRLYNYDEYEC